MARISSRTCLSAHICLSGRSPEIVEGRRAGIHVLDLLEYYIYILANKKRGTTYIGVTSDLAKRVWEHKNHVVNGFTTRYDVNKLVYYESTNEAFKAIEREKRIKKWKRDWKIELIESKNPKWRDLFEELI